MNAPRSAAALALCICLTATVATAASGDLNISPTVVELRGGSANDTVTLENRGDSEIRIELTGFAWGETDKGEMTLTPADALIFYPTLLTIEPKHRRVVRVGLSDAAPDQIERTYRIFFSELPPAPSAAATGANVQLLTKIGIPVFLEPKGTASPEPDIVDAAFANGAYHFALVNRGNAHVLAQDVIVTAKDADGHPVLQKTLDAWYLLANGTRSFSVPMTAAECARVRDVDIVMQGPRRADLTRTFGKPACT